MPAERLDEVSAIMDARNRFFQHGPKVLSSSELVALVLGTGAIKNAFEVAQQVVHQYDGLLGVAQLALVELKDHDGMGLMKAMQLQAAIEIGKRLHVEQIEQFNPRLRIKCPSDAAQLVLMEMSLLEQEQLRVMLLDRRGGLLKICDLYQGTLYGVTANAGEIFRDAIRHNSAAIIVAHNHPSGDPTPTDTDIHMTRTLIKAGELLDIEVTDHLVIGGGKYISLREHGFGFESSPVVDEQFDSEEVEPIGINDRMKNSHVQY
jgi:DNA repair protein RadC